MCLLQGSWVGQLPLATTECLIPDYCKAENFVKSLLHPSLQTNIYFQVFKVFKLFWSADAERGVLYLDWTFPFEM